MRKGQVANEFIILLGVGIIFLLIFLYAISDDIRSLTVQKEENAIKDVGFSTQNEFFFAAGSKDGYKRTFTVPDTHNGVSYTIDILGGYLILESTKNNQIREFAIPPVIGNITKGENNISKTGGVIYLN